MHFIPLKYNKWEKVPVYSLHIVLIMYSDSCYPSLCLLVSCENFINFCFQYFFYIVLVEYYESVALIWVGILCYISGGSKVFVFAS